MLILTACIFSNTNTDDYYSPINKVDKLKYLNFFNKNLSLLKIPDDVNVTILDLNSDYYIPPIDSVKYYDLSMNINIYPPMIFGKISNESCLINVN